jgi:amino acid transporter
MIGGRRGPQTDRKGGRPVESVGKSSLKVDVGEHGLKQHDLRVWTVMFMVFSLVAAGAYGIEEMIPASGAGLTLVMLMVLPFLWGLPFGLVASELGSVRPQEGGYYKWVQEALGEFWGFMAGWWRTISVYIDNTLYVILAGGYLASQWDLNGYEQFAIKATMIIIFTYINIRGVKDVGFITTILSVLVIAAFAIVAIAGFMNWSLNPFEPFTSQGEIMGASGISGSEWIMFIGAGLAIGMWMYSGYESMSTIAGELKNPQVIPKATLLTIPLIMAVYIVPTIAGLGSIGQWDSWGTTAESVGYADVVTTFWGAGFGIFFVIVAVLAQCSIYNTYIASGSRGFFALADDHLAPKTLVKVDKKHGVPYVAVLSVGVVNLILCNFAFTTVVIVDVFLLISSYILVYISAMILRKRIPKEEYKFRIPGGYPFLVLLCVVPIIIGVVSFFINGTDFFIGGLIGIATGPIMYVIWKLKYGGLAKKDPVNYPLNPRTRLGMGDLKRMAGVFFGFAVVGFAAVPWLRWFEGDWAADYYGETYSAWYYGFLDNFDSMLTAILIIAGIFLALAVGLAIAAFKLEPRKGAVSR